MAACTQFGEWGQSCWVLHAGLKQIGARPQAAGPDPAGSGSMAPGLPRLSQTWCTP